MNTEDWVNQQIDHYSKLKRAYELLYEVWLQRGYSEKGEPILPKRIDDELEAFFRGGW